MDQTLPTSYIRRRNTNPLRCVAIRTVKFKDLLDYGAKDLGCGCFGDRALYPYPQRHRRTADHAEMHKAVDPKARIKAIFFLQQLRNSWNYLRFPLGAIWSKPDDVRVLAEKYGLAVSNKPDSQDICFVPEGGYADVIERLRPGRRPSRVKLFIWTGVCLVTP